MHWGDAKNSYEGAAKCYSIANLGLTILREMDLHRRTMWSPRDPDADLGVGDPKTMILGACPLIPSRIK